MKKCVIEILRGVEGRCVLINNLRVAGPKAWGGGDVEMSFVADAEDLKAAIRRVKSQAARGGEGR
jgi:hypothetical protein